jgi:RNA:NAD 2'-phosphotransferase (TPT1/KptA family)
MLSPPDYKLLILNEQGINTLKKIFKLKKIDLLNSKIKSLHLLLRHSDDINNCDTGGFFPVDFVLKNLSINIDKLVSVVYFNDKNRYQFGILNKKLYVRATQGHSGLILKHLIPSHIFEIYTDNDNLYHRTKIDNCNFIFSNDENINGIRPINRQVHMAKNIKLLRNKEKYPIDIVINTKKVKENGIILYKAANDVVLSYDKIPKSCIFLEF